MDISLSSQGFQFSQVYSSVRAGLDLLRQLGDRASVFIPGVSQANGPVNLHFPSDFSTGTGWIAYGGSFVGNILDSKGGSSAFRISGNPNQGYYSASGTAGVIGVKYTLAQLVRPFSNGNVCNMIVNQSVFGGTGGDRVLSVDCSNGSLVYKSADFGNWSATPVAFGYYLMAVSFVPTANVAGIVVGTYANANGQVFDFNGMGVFQGEYTAQQLLNLGGIPLTTTAPSAASYSSFLSGASLNIASPEKTAVGPVNLLKYSTNLVSGWVSGGSTIIDATTLQFRTNPQSQAAQGTNALTVEPYTYAVLASVDSGSRNVRLKHWDGTTDNFTPNLEITTTPRLLVQNTTGTTFAATNFAICNDTAGSVGTINVLAQGLFRGTFTASQILANGGIPITYDTPQPNFVTENTVVQSPSYGIDVGPSTRSVSGWGASNSTIVSDGTSITLTVTGGSSSMSKAVTVVPGQPYEVQFALQRGTTPNNNQFKLGTNSTGQEYSMTQIATSGTYTLYVVPTQATMWITMGYGETAVSQTSIWSDIKVRPIVTQAGSNLLTNGDFSSGTDNWSVNAPNTIAVVNGQLEITSGTNGSSISSQPLNLTPGARYLVIGKYWDYSGEGVAITAMSTQFGSTFASAVTAGGVSSGTLVFSFTAPQAAVWIGPRIANATAAGKKARFDELIVQQIVTSPVKLSPLAYVDSNAATAASVDGPVGFLSDADCTGVDITQDGTIWSGFNSTLSNSSSYPITATSTAASNYGLQISNKLTIGATYRVVVKWRGNTSGRTVKIDANGNVALGSGVSGFASGIFQATNSTHYVYVTTATSAGETFIVDSVATQRLTGNHATQSTTANKPTLRRGVVNLVLQSGDLTTAQWEKNFTTASRGQTDSSGGNSANLLQINTASTLNVFCRTVGTQSVIVGCPYTLYIVAKAGTNNWINFQTSDFTANAFGGYMNLANGSFGSVTVAGSGAVQNYTSASVGNGFYLFAINGTFSSTSNQKQSITLPSGDNVTTATNGSTVIVEKVGFSIGTFTAQQIIALGGIPLTTSVPSSSSLGNYSLEFNGSTSILNLQAAPFSATDDHVIVAGCSPVRFSGDSTVFGMRSSTNNTPVLGQLGFTSTAPDIAMRSDATALFRATAGSSSSLVPQVISGVRKSANLDIRRNGVVVGNNPSVESAVTSVNTFTIGGVQVVAGTSNQFAGSVCPVIIAKGTLTNSEILTLERFVGALTGPTGIVF